MERQDIVSRKSIIDTIAWLVIGIIFTGLLTGFSFSDPKKLRQELRKEVLEELEKIVEKTPSAKLRNKWRQTRDKAKLQLQQALAQGAPKYCPKKWDESVALFNRAMDYAAKRAYRKAIYLAKKTRETAQSAYKCANKYIEAKRSTLLKQYKKLREKIDDIRGLIPPDAEELIDQASELSLDVEDMALAIDLRQFKDASRLAKTLSKKLTRLERAVTDYNRQRRSETDHEI